MASRTWRLILVFVLVASGAGAALAGWNASRRIADVERTQRDLDDRLDGLNAALDAAMMPGSIEAPRDPRLTDRLRAEADALGPHLRSVEAGQALQTVATSVTTLRDVDSRAREHLRLGQELMAADIITTEAPPAAAVAAAALRTLRTAEAGAAAIARADALDSVWTIGGTVAALWLLGVILLVRVPAQVRDQLPTPAAEEMPAMLDDGHASQSASDPDLQAAADVCTAIGRLTSADDLPRLLQQAASVIGASGVVVWMAAGEELFAAAAFGYAPQVIRTLGPINLSAINATAAAWRSGTLQTVSGRAVERGALAAPMLGPERCVGVLAVEVRTGLEEDGATRALTTLVAAQLAAVLAAWPAASAAAPVEAPPLERAAEA